MKCIIIDDNNSNIETLVHLIQIKTPLNIQKICTSKLDAIINIPFYQPDIIFINTIINNKLCFEILDHCKGHYKHVVFISSNIDLILKSFDYPSIQYLLTPIMDEDFKKITTKIECIINN